MEIIDLRKEICVKPFEFLNLGTVFAYQNSIWIKIDGSLNHNNAYDLRQKRKVTLHCNDFVEPVNSTLTIRI